MAPETGGWIKGLTLKGRFHFVALHYGEDALRQVLQELSAESRETLAKRVTATSWYPFSLQLELDDAICTVLMGSQAEEDYRRLGAGNAAFQFAENTRQPATNPHLVAQSVAHLYQRYQRPGRMDYRRVDTHRAGIDVLEGVCVPRSCWVNAGYLTEAVSQAGVADVKVAVTGCGATPSRCHYDVRWHPA